MFKKKQTYKLLFVGTGVRSDVVRESVKDLPIAVIVDANIGAPMLLDTQIEVEKK